MPRSHELLIGQIARAGVARALLVGATLLGPLTADATATRTPTGGGGSVVLEPVPPSESRRTWRRLVYTCTSPGLVVFSDRPCGPVPIVHEVKGHGPRDAPGTAGASATVVPPKPAASTRPAPFDAQSGRNDDDATAQRDATCRRLQDAVRSLDDRMRAGYSAREAALLWSRWREAKERLREADC
jgi:hypothetical protein